MTGKTGRATEQKNKIGQASNLNKLQKKKRNNIGTQRQKKTKKKKEKKHLSRE